MGRFTWKETHNRCSCCFGSMTKEGKCLLRRCRGEAIPYKVWGVTIDQCRCYETFVPAKNVEQMAKVRGKPKWIIHRGKLYITCIRCSRMIGLDAGYIGNDGASIPRHSGDCFSCPHCGMAFSPFLWSWKENGKGVKKT